MTPDVFAWQALCAQCAHLLRSGNAGDVWHCAAAAKEVRVIRGVE